MAILERDFPYRDWRKIGPMLQLSSLELNRLTLLRGERFPGIKKAPLWFAKGQYLLGTCPSTKNADVLFSLNTGEWGKEIRRRRARERKNITKKNKSSETSVLAEYEFPFPVQSEVSVGPVSTSLTENGTQKRQLSALSSANLTHFVIRLKKGHYMKA